MMKRRLPGLLNLLLLLTCAAVGVYWTLQLTTGGVPKEPLVSVPTTDRIPRTQPLDVAPLSRLFGAGTGSSAPANIRLSGVIAEGARGKGTALLAIGDGPAMAYRTGDAIDERTRLGAVHADRVVLYRGGAPIELLLPERLAPSGIAPAPAKTVVPRSADWRR